MADIITDASYIKTPKESVSQIQPRTDSIAIRAKTWLCHFMKDKMGIDEIDPAILISNIPEHDLRNGSKYLWLRFTAFLSGSIYICTFSFDECLSNTEITNPLFSGLVIRVITSLHDGYLLSIYENDHLRSCTNLTKRIYDQYIESIYSESWSFTVFLDLFLSLNVKSNATETDLQLLYESNYKLLCLYIKLCSIYPINLIIMDENGKRVDISSVKNFSVTNLQYAIELSGPVYGLCVTCTQDVFKLHMRIGQDLEWDFLNEYFSCADPLFRYVCEITESDLDILFYNLYCRIALDIAYCPGNPVYLTLPLSPTAVSVTTIRDTNTVFIFKSDTSQKLTVDECINQFRNNDLLQKAKK